MSRSAPQSSRSEGRYSMTGAAPHFTLLIAAGFAALVCHTSFAFAQTAPDLGEAGHFAVLATNAIPTSGTVTCTTSTINGDVGTTGASITNTLCTINGTIDAPVSGQVVTD